MVPLLIVWCFWPNQKWFIFIVLQPADWDDREYIEDPNDVKPEVLPNILFNSVVEIVIYICSWYILHLFYLLWCCRDMILSPGRFLILRLKRSVWCPHFRISCVPYPFSSGWGLKHTMRLFMDLPAIIWRQCSRKVSSILLSRIQLDNWIVRLWIWRDYLGLLVDFNSHSLEDII